MNLSHSASSLSLQQAFSELKHGTVPEGPSTAPPVFNQAIPSFPSLTTSEVGPLPSVSVTAPSASLPSTTNVSLPATQSVSTQPVETLAAGLPTSKELSGSNSPPPVLQSGPQLVTGVASSISAPSFSSSASQVVSAIGEVAPSVSTPTSLTLSQSGTTESSVGISGTMSLPVTCHQIGSVFPAALQTSVPVSLAQNVVPSHLSTSTSVPSLAEMVAVSVLPPKPESEQLSDKLQLGSVGGTSLPISVPLSSAMASSIPGSVPQSAGVQPLPIPLVVTSSILAPVVGAASTPVLPHVPLPGILPQAQPIANVPIVQQTLVHSQPQPAPLPNQPHIHCLEADADSQPKAPGIDDIKTLEEKLRSLFSEHSAAGAAHSSVSLDTSLPVETTVMPGQPTTVVAPTKPVAPIASTSVPPATLLLGQTGLPVMTPVATPVQAGTPISCVPTACVTAPGTAKPGTAGTPPSKAPLSRVPVRNQYFYEHMLKIQRDAL